MNSALFAYELVTMYTFFSKTRKGGWVVRLSLAALLVVDTLYTLAWMASVYLYNLQLGQQGLFIGAWQECKNALVFRSLTPLTFPIPIRTDIGLGTPVSPVLLLALPDLPSLSSPG